MKKFFWKIAVAFDILLLTACSGGPEEFKVTVPTQQAEEAQGYDYTDKEIWCGEGERKIYGVASIPNGEGEFPLVILSNGLGETHEGTKRYIESLTEAGVAVYAFDFCGGAKDSRSTGEMTDMSVMTEVEDLGEVIKAAQSWHFVDKNKIVLLGFSQGGMVSAIAAARWEDKISGLILGCPAFVIPDDAHNMFERKEDIPETFSYRELTLGRRYFEDVWNYNVYDDIAKFKKKVLLIHGDRDQAVDVSYSERAAEVYEDAELHLIKGERHYFSDESLGEIHQCMLDYLHGIGVI